MMVREMEVDGNEVLEAARPIFVAAHDLIPTDLLQSVVCSGTAGAPARRFAAEWRRTLVLLACDPVGSQGHR